MSCGGSLTSRRVRLTLSPMIVPRSIAALVAAGPEQMRAKGWRFFSARYRSCPWQPTIAPATAASVASAASAVVEKERHAVARFAGQRAARRRPRERPCRRRMSRARPGRRPEVARRRCPAEPTAASISNCLPVISLRSMRFGSRPPVARRLRRPRRQQGVIGKTPTTTASAAVSVTRGIDALDVHVHRPRG